MTDAHLHLLVNHIPIVGTPLVALLLGAALVRGSRELLGTALVAAVLIAVAGAPAYFTGEDAEHQIRKASWFKRETAHEHEERGEKAIIALGLTGVVAAAGWWRLRSKPEDRLLAGVTLAGLVVSAALMAWTGAEGGEIRHEQEIDGVPFAPADAAAPGAPAAEHD